MKPPIDGYLEASNYSLKIKIGDIDQLRVKEKFNFKEGKTGKDNYLFMNKPLMRLYTPI